jgi:hypothetical protein
VERSDTLPPGKFVRGPAAVLWRHTLIQIPTTFGRLVYLASLRNQNTGLYEHHGLSQIFGQEEADRTLRQSHSQVFAEWLCFGLEHQKGELNDYLEELDGPTVVILENWVRLCPYRNFIPLETREVERRLYLSDLETVLTLLSRERGAVYPDREA